MAQPTQETPAQGWQETRGLPRSPAGGSGPGYSVTPGAHEDGFFHGLWERSAHAGQEFLDTAASVRDYAWNGTIGFEHSIRNVYHALLRGFWYAPGAIARLTGHDVKEFADGFLQGLTIMLGVLILSSVVGGVAGAALGSLAGGVGAIPAGAAGAELGFNVGMALLTWMGVAALVPLVAHHLGKMLQTAQRGIAKAWHAGQSRLTSEEQDIDDGGKLLGEAVGEFFVAFLEGLVMWVLKGEAVSSTKGSIAKLANPKAVMERQALLSARINEMYIMLRNSRLGPRFAEWFRSNINGLIEWYQKRHAQPATSGLEETAATRAPSRGSAGADLAKTEINGITPVRVRPGTNGKVAVIGRSMGSGVDPYASGLKARGYDVETFSGDQISLDANKAWEDLVKQYKPNRVPDDAIPNSEMFQENEAWAQKLRDQNYTVVDVGDPSGQGPSAFYSMEQRILFGK